MFNKYYQDELIFLREMGRDFAKVHPEAAPLLAEAGSDPGVERMLEGVAFIAGRIREKLDDELPEITHSLLATFFPHYLQPLPSLTTLQYEPLPQFAREAHRIPRGTPVDSVPVEGTRCHFQTCQDLDLVPLKIRTVELIQGVPARLTIRIDLLDPLAAGKLRLERLRLHLAGDAAVSRALYLCLCRYSDRVSLRVGDLESTLPAVTPVGFAANDALHPHAPPSAGPFRLLEEYFTFPSRFMYVDVTGLDRIPALIGATTFDLVFALRQLPEAMPPVNANNVQLNCTPAINIFAHDADPIRLGAGRSEHQVRPAGRDPTHFEIAAISSVQGLQRGQAHPRTFRPYLNLTRTEGGEGPFYLERRRPALVGRGHDLSVSVVGAPTEGETLSLTLLCTNRHLPESLAPGDIATATPHSPAFARCRNITKPLPTVAAPIDGDLPWRFLSHLALNHLSFADPVALRRVLDLYNPRARSDHQAAQAHRRLLDGIQTITSRPATRMVGGAPMRGLALDVTINEDHCGSPGEFYLFAVVLDRFLARAVSMNSFTQVTVRGLRQGEVHAFPARLGDRNLV